MNSSLISLLFTLGTRVQMILFSEMLNQLRKNFNFSPSIVTQKKGAKLVIHLGAFI